MRINELRRLIWSMVSCTVLSAVLFLVTPRLLSAQCPPVECFGMYEAEPNDAPETANPVSIQDPVCGMLDHPGDTDFFILEPAAECFEFQLNGDTFDARVQIWGMGPAGFEVLASFNDGGYCEPETGNWIWDPCAQATETAPPWIVEVAADPEAPPGAGNYQLDIFPIPRETPPGDCAAYALYVPEFPYNTDGNTFADFRDTALEPSPDVWYSFFLPQEGTLEAWTCEGLTDFPTHLALLAEDGVTLLRESFTSGMCEEDFPEGSWISPCLEPGAYFLVVEGAGSTAGNYTLNMEFTPSLQHPELVAGEWGADAEEWHQRFTGDYPWLNFLIDDPCGSVVQVDFFQSADGINWEFLGTDNDGAFPRLATVTPGDDGDGWHFSLDPHAFPCQDPAPIWFQATAQLSNGGQVSAVCSTFYDPVLNRERLATSLDPWNEVYSDTINIMVNCADPQMIDSLSWRLFPKDSVFMKGVPHVNQRSLSDFHCAPTAAAACLKYFDAHGDPGIDGGLSALRLARRLGRMAKTGGNDAPDSLKGTDSRDLVKALKQWLQNHGNGYTVRGPMAFNWNRARTELEQGQDVLLGLKWTDSSGEHMVTMNSIHNKPDAQGKITVDFMDPWTGQTEYGKLDPRTGDLTDYADDPPDYNNRTAEMSPNVIFVCPAQQQPGWGGPGGGGGIGGGQAPWPPVDQFPVVLPGPGLYFLKLIFHDRFGKVREDIVVVERLVCTAPQVQIVLREDGTAVILSWPPVEEADSYSLYSSTDPYFVNPPGQLCATTEATVWSMDIGGNHLFFKVVSNCEP